MSAVISPDRHESHSRALQGKLPCAKKHAGVLLPSSSDASMKLHHRFCQAQDLLYIALGVGAYGSGPLGVML